MIRNTTQFRKPWARGRLLILLIASASLGCSCLLSPSIAAQSREATINGHIMGTYYRVTVAGTSADRLTSLGPGVLAVLRNVDRDMSTYRADSSLSRVNRAPGGIWSLVPGSLVDVVTLALSVSESSHGAFDVTAGPLVNLWGFGPAERVAKPPSPGQIAAVRDLVSFKALDVRRQPPALRKAADGVYVDLSAVAKGYAVDEVSRFLSARGVQHYLVDVGGELRAGGLNADGKAWSIAVETPRAGSQRGVQRLIHLSDRAVATSGDYRNFFEHNGRRFSHLIDPRTGHPVEHGLVSATVVAETAALADAYATAVLVLGPDEGLALLERRRLHGMLIHKTDDGYRELFTSGFRTLLGTGQ